MGQQFANFAWPRYRNFAANAPVHRFRDSIGNQYSFEPGTGEFGEWVS